MRETMSCDGCGETRFRVAETYAVVAGGADAEVLVWACLGCDGRVEEQAPVTSGQVTEARPIPRVA